MSETTVTSVEFTAAEIKFLQRSPAALEALMIYHECKSIEADALDFPESAATHNKRLDELESMRRLHADGHGPAYPD